MDQNICQSRLLQRAAKRVNQKMRKLADKTDRIGKQHLAPAGERQGAGGRIQRREQRVLLQYPGICQHIQKRGLSRIGVSDNRGGFSSAFQPSLPQHIPVPFYQLQLFFQRADSVRNQPPVHLQLFFSRASGSDSSPQTGERFSQSRKPGLSVTELCQLHLYFSLAGSGPPREDIQDQQRPVADLAAQLLLQIFHLRGRKLIVADHRRGVHQHCHLPQFFQLSASQVRTGIRKLTRLHQAGYRHRPGSFRQRAQLPQADLRLFLFSPGNGK